MKKITCLVKPGRMMTTMGQDRSYTTDVNYIDNNGKILHKDEFVGDRILSDDSYERINADTFFDDNQKAKILAKANLVYRKTKKGYELVKQKHITFGINFNNEDRSDINQKHRIVAENKAHIQYISTDSYFGATFRIMRKDEHKYKIA